MRKCTCIFVAVSVIEKLNEFCLHSTRQVNDVNFENMTNDEAVRVLREVVQKPGPIKLVVAKCWDPNPKGYFTIPRTEPVRPIDPGAWVAHTQAVTAQDPLSCQDVGSIHGHMHNIGIASLSSTISNQLQNPTLMIQERLNRNNLEDIVKAMTKPDSGLDIRDRMWLKIVIPNAFIGSDAVNWVQANVDGISDRRDARRVVSSMLRNNLIKHVVNKLSFSEQCYYVLSDGSRQSEYYVGPYMRNAAGSVVVRAHWRPAPIRCVQ